MSLAELTREGAQVVSRLELYLDGAQVGTDAEIVSGSVTYDTSARVLRSCQVQLHGTIPVGPQDPLAPIGSVIRLFRGARDWTGELFEEPLGAYAFDESSVERGDRLVRVTGYDYSQLVSDARWEEPYEIARGTNLADAIEEALESRLPAALWREPNMASTSSTTPAIAWGEERENDPWADLTDLARGDGRLLHFDRTGRATLIPVPDPDAAPVAWDFTVGEEPTLLTTSKVLDGRPYNVVVARGEPEGDADPVEATAEDDDPHSASYVGRYRKPYFLTSGYMESESQALAAARGELRRKLGLGEVVTLRTIPIPSLDVWQVIRAHDPELGIDARYVIDKLRLPLPPGEATLTTRRRRI